ncbi:hypothetical protein Acsp03_67350 [Actinomadura sp. NBRC 104412]|nr:hypothetical protein Acsp03_67350 [Actinomadura sp. NBRC 104412]
MVNLRQNDPRERGHVFRGSGGTDCKGVSPLQTNPTATTSARWHAPELCGDHWVARVRYRVSEREHAAGIEPAVFGPTLDACVRETARMDRLWALFPARNGDSGRSRERARFLASDDVGDVSGTTDGGAA